jgi:hypothetical protein
VLPQMVHVPIQKWTRPGHRGTEVVYSVTVLRMKSK